MLIIESVLQPGTCYTIYILLNKELYKFCFVVVGEKIKGMIWSMSLITTQSGLLCLNVIKKYLDHIYMLLNNNSIIIN